jgi:hypothetical protein
VMTINIFIAVSRDCVRWMTHSIVKELRRR